MSENELLRSVLGKGYIEIAVHNVIVDDDTYGSCVVGIDISTNTDNPAYRVKGGGVGMVDAMFGAFREHFSSEYESLKTIELSDFKVTLTKKRAANYGSKIPGTDAYCETHLQVRNSYGRAFDFVVSSCSLVASAALVVARVVEHFLNAERAYIALHGALEDARQRNRQDLVTRYTKELAEVVKCTSYTSILEQGWKGSK